jgi:trehalose-phosphatase
MAAGRRLLLVSDFDGTLAGLVPDPWGATIVPAARRALRRLAAVEGVTIALLSGRTVPDLAGRARVGGVHYLGDHGAEWAVAPRPFRAAGLRVTREPASTAETSTVELLARAVPRLVGEAWLVVEDKGSALTFHFRTAPDVDRARERVAAAVEALDPGHVLARSGGRRSLELRPAGASDKGAALRWLIERLGPDVVVMLGDDHTDALAFATLRASRRSGRIDGLALAVAGHPDGRAQVIAHADGLLASPRETARLLTLLAGALHGRSTAPGGVDRAATAPRAGARARSGRRRLPRSSRARPGSPVARGR